MSEIRVKEGESLESAPRRFKRSTARSGVLVEVRKREAYEKPFVRRKKKSEAASASASLSNPSHCSGYAAVFSITVFTQRERQNRFAEMRARSFFISKNRGGAVCCPALIIR